MGKSKLGSVSVPSEVVGLDWTAPADEPYILLEDEGDLVRVTHRLIISISGRPTLLQGHVTSRPLKSESAFELVSNAARGSNVAVVHYRRVT